MRPDLVPAPAPPPPCPPHELLGSLRRRSKRFCTIQDDDGSPPGLAEHVLIRPPAPQHARQRWHRHPLRRPWARDFASPARRPSRQRRRPRRPAASGQRTAPNGTRRRALDVPTTHPVDAARFPPPPRRSSRHHRHRQARPSTAHDTGHLDGCARGLGGDEQEERQGPPGPCLTHAAELVRAGPSYPARRPDAREEGCSRPRRRPNCWDGRQRCVRVRASRASPKRRLTGGRSAQLANSYQELLE